MYLHLYPGLLLAERRMPGAEFNNPTLEKCQTQLAPVTLAFVQALERAKIFVSHLRPSHMLIPVPGMFFLLPGLSPYAPNTTSHTYSAPMSASQQHLLSLLFQFSLSHISLSIPFTTPTTTIIFYYLLVHYQSLPNKWWAPGVRDQTCFVHQK